ncbi:MAG: hypothetical protein JO280_01675 [Mycobacteriaceae bacterium]|nr:hypothetical protein [Mycobacteriaceae bacterium]
MHTPVRLHVTKTIAIAALSSLAVTVASVPADDQSPWAVRTYVGLSAATSAAPATAPGALIEQFLANQAQNCSLICPFIIQGAVSVPFDFAILPLTLVRELGAGVPPVQAALLSDATVSGALDDAVTGIITNDLSLVLPRAQNALEVAVVGLIDIGITAVTQPGNVFGALTSARSSFLTALTQPPGTMPPPPVHNALEAILVRAIEVASSLTFQAPERLLLGISQAANAFFTAIGATGNIAATVQAVGASVSATISDSVGFIRHALTEPIPITAAPAPTANEATTSVAKMTNRGATFTTTPTNTPANASVLGASPIAPPPVAGRPVTRQSARTPASAVVQLRSTTNHLPAQKPPERHK